MVEVASVNQKVQVGVEATEGTAVAAPTQLTSMGFAFAPQINVRADHATGSKWPSVATPGKEWSESDIDGQLTYTEPIYPLSSCVGNIVTTSLGGSPTAYQHVFSLSLATADVVKSFTVQQGDPITRARQIAGVKVDAFGFEFDRDGATVKGHALGKAISFGQQMSTNAKYTLTAAGSPPTAGTFTLTYASVTSGAIAFGATPATVQTALEAMSTIGVGNVVVSLTSGGPTLATAAAVYTIEFRAALAQRAITLTGTFTGLTPSNSIALASGVTGVAPASLALVPIAGQDWSVYLDTTWAGLGGTKLLRHLSGAWGIADRFSPVWVTDQAQTSYVATVEKVPSGEITLMMEADAQWEGFLTQLRAGTTVFQRIEAVGAQISGANNYRFRVDTALKLTDIGNLGDQDDVFAGSYTGVPSYDPTSGNICQVTVVNTLASVA